VSKLLVVQLANHVGMAPTVLDQIAVLNMLAGKEVIVSSDFMVM